MKKLLTSILCICILSGILSACTSNTLPIDNPSESDTEPINTESENDVGGSQFCDAHYEQYHEFTTELTDMIGMDEFNNWIQATKETNKNTTSDCTMLGENIKEFIDYFKIPREKFDEYCNKRWSSVHNADLLYTDDMDAIEEYYRDIDARNVTRNKQTRLYSAKDRLVDMYIKELSDTGKSEEEFSKIKEEVSFTKWVSMFRIIELFEVDRETLETVIQQEKEENYTDNNHYNYRFDLVYNEDGTLKEYDHSKNVTELDALFAGVDNFFTD